MISSLLPSRNVVSLECFSYMVPRTFPRATQHPPSHCLGREVQGSEINKKYRTQPGFCNSHPYTKAMEVKCPGTGLVPAVAGTGCSPGCPSCGGVLGRRDMLKRHEPGRLVVCEGYFSKLGAQSRFQHKPRPCPVPVLGTCSCSRWHRPPTGFREVGRRYVKKDSVARRAAFRGPAAMREGVKDLGAL